MAITNGPNRAKPSANAALDVRAKRPLAARSWDLGTTNGIIEASAGPKKVVSVETTTMSRYSRSRLLVTKKTATKATPRSTFVATRTSRLSIRSTKTPAMAEKTIAGARKHSRRTLMAIFEPL